MVFAGDVRTLDLEDLTALAGAYAVECEATRATRPGWVPLGQAARVAAWRADDGWTRHLVGAFEGETLVGFAITSTAHDAPDTTWLDVSVLPRRQRRGVGARLVRAAESSSPDPVTRFVASAYRPDVAEVAELERGFARPLGYSRATTETVVELHLLAASPPTAPAPEGYRVTSYLNGVPAGLRAQVGVLKGLVDAEAPHGELEWQPTPVSVEAYQAEMGLWRGAGAHGDRDGRGHR